MLPTFVVVSTVNIEKTLRGILEKLHFIRLKVLAIKIRFHHNAAAETISLDTWLAL